MENVETPMSPWVTTIPSSLEVTSPSTASLPPKMPSPEEASTSSPSPEPQDGAAPAPAPTTPATFKSLGLIDPLLEALEQMKFKAPTDIQSEVLPHALQGRDIIGVASTGSGKTAAFALPILQKLWDDPKGLFACVIAPTRELAFQITQQFESIGSAMGVRCVTIIGGVDIQPQKIALAKKPHVVVATPGRLLEHLEETKGFSLRNLKFLVRIQSHNCRDNSHRMMVRSSMKPTGC